MIFMAQYPYLRIRDGTRAATGEDRLEAPAGKIEELIAYVPVLGTDGGAEQRLRLAALFGRHRDVDVSTGTRARVRIQLGQCPALVVHRLNAGLTKQLRGLHQLGSELKAHDHIPAAGILQSGDNRDLGPRG